MESSMRNLSAPARYHFPLYSSCYLHCAADRGRFASPHFSVGRSTYIQRRNSSAPQEKMVVPPPVRPSTRVTKFLKPYVLKMHFTNKFVNAQVIHSPTATIAASASSQEKALRSSMENTGDVAAAAKVGKILGERLLLHGMPAISVFWKREQKYHGKVKALIDSVRNAGIQLL